MSLINDAIKKANQANKQAASLPRYYGQALERQLRRLK